MNKKEAGDIEMGNILEVRAEKLRAPLKEVKRYGASADRVSLALATFSSVLPNVTMIALSPSEEKENYMLPKENESLQEFVESSKGYAAKLGERVLVFKRERTRWVIDHVITPVAKVN